jgi:hypothetical protein
MISSADLFGLVHLYPSNRNPDSDPVKDVRAAMDRTGRAALENSDIVLGVKIQIGSNMNGRYSLDFLKIARELCDKYKQRLMVHISFAPPSTDEVMALMRPGDIVTHCFNTHTIGILDEQGKVKPSVRTRGPAACCSMWAMVRAASLRDCPEGAERRIRSGLDLDGYLLTTSKARSTTCRLRCPN